MFDADVLPPLPRDGRRLLGIQLVCSLSVAALFALLLGLGAGASALLGGGICLSGAWLSARIAFVRRDLSPRTMLMALYLGEGGKMVWTLCAFCLSFLFLKPQPVVCIASYIMVLLSHSLVFSLRPFGGESPPRKGGDSAVRRPPVRGAGRNAPSAAMMSLPPEGGDSAMEGRRGC